MNSAEFREAMAHLPEPPSNSRPPFWDYWRHDLWARAQAEPVENFMDWPCVRHTMLVQHFSIGAQLSYLQADWERWEPVVADAGCEANQRNLINQAYHLKLWEDTTGRRVSDLGSIVEFGGGYGAMALVARRAGFRGWYTIQDLPEFSLLQRWWLAGQGVDKVAWVSGAAALDADLFVGIYSISEVPPAERALRLGESGSYLLLYSSAFAEYDNVAWANDLMTATTATHNWRVMSFPGRPDFYAIGWLK